MPEIILKKQWLKTMRGTGRNRFSVDPGVGDVSYFKTAEKRAHQSAASIVQQRSNLGAQIVERERLADHLHPGVEPA
jgi:hypothetical protein